MYFIAYKSLLRRKSRTVLAAAGIALGIMLVVVLTSISLGMTERTKEFTLAMTGETEVIQKNMRSLSLSEIDKDIVDTIKKIPGADIATPRVYENIEISGFRAGASSMHFGGRGGGGLTLVGIDPSMEKIIGSFPTQIVKGTLFRKGSSKVAVIGTGIADPLNKDIGDTITVIFDKEEDGIDENDKHDFKVVGIYETGSALTDNRVVVSLEEAQKIKGLKSTQVSTIAVQIEPQLVDSVARKIKLRVKDVDIGSRAAMLERITEFSSQMSLMTFLIGAIAALIGGIGVANTMIMSVIERTREIGVLRATGWYKLDVLKLIMFESILVSVLGTLGGIGIGILILITIPSAFQEMFQPVLDYDLLVRIFLFGLSLGVVGGLYPAMRAANMSPVEAFGGGE